MRRADRLFHIIQLIRGRRLTTAAYLAGRLEVSERTIYRDVFKLEPGHSLTVSASAGRRRCYWAPAFSTAPARLDDTVEELRSLARSAVSLRMISDVPLGAFLSGGVDSSAAVAFMAEQAPDRVKTFSIGFTERKFDELEYARLAVDRSMGEPAQPLGGHHGHGRVEQLPSSRAQGLGRHRSPPVTRDTTGRFGNIRSAPYLLHT